MKTPSLHVSRSGLVVALVAMLPFAALAQSTSPPPPPPPRVAPPVEIPRYNQDSADQNSAEAGRIRKNRDTPMTMREKRAARLAQLHKSDQGDEAATSTAPLYPLATRQEPEAQATRAGTKRLQAISDDLAAGNNDKAIAAAIEVGNDPESNAYEKSFAYQVAGNAAANSDNDAAAADYFAKAIAADGLGNNDHFTVMYNLTATQYGLGQNEQALKTLDRFLAETKSDKLEMMKLRGGILMQLDRNAEAADVFSKLVVAHPDDKALRLNAVAAYQQAEQPEQAMALLADANAKGMLTSANEYRALYVSYINADRDKDALALIDEAIAKGVVQPDADLAKVYMVIGQKAYYAEDMPTAIDMYKRAAPIAADGEASLNLAKILFDTGKKTEAKAAAQQALEKGVKDAAQAKRFIGGS